jgi:hypothetical protein
MEGVNTYYKKSTIIAVIVVLLILIGLTASSLRAIDSHDAALSSPKVVSATETAKTVISYTAVAGITVLAQLESREQIVILSSAQPNANVESINGLKNGTDNKHWSYYVNSKLADTSAGQYVTKGGEKIVWEFK